MTLRATSNRARWRKAGRLAGYASLIQLAVAFAGFPLARAHAEKTLERAGLALLDSLGPALIGPPRAVTVNGQRLFFASKPSALGVAEVLDAVQRHCQEPQPSREPQEPGARELGAWLAPIAARDTTSLAVEGWLAARTETQETGQVACFAAGPGAVASRIEAALEFIESGDLSSFGEARYVVARRDAASATTHVLAVWAEGRFDVRAMFPADVDAPGPDPLRAARPAASVRRLSARLEGEAYGIYVYATAAPADRVFERYQAQMEASGFEPIVLSRQEAAGMHEPRTRAFMDAAGAVLIVARPDGAQTLVSVLELGGPGSVQVAPREAR